MKILHLSDIHLTKHGEIIWGADTLSNLNKALDKIKEIPNIDAIIISGDISNDGSLWTYEYIDGQFGKLNIPVYCCPGNHDNIRVMMTEFSPKFIKIVDKTIIAGWQFYFLNSVVRDEKEPTQNKARGLLSKNSLCQLEQDLKQNNIPTIIVLHHPPKEPGGWINRRLLDNRNEFNDLIKQYNNVKLVLYGHIHYSTQNYNGNIIYSSASSIGYAFDKYLPNFQIAKGQEGFNLIELNNTEIHIERFFLD